MLSMFTATGLIITAVLITGITLTIRGVSNAEGAFAEWIFGGFQHISGWFYNLWLGVASLVDILELIFRVFAGLPLPDRVAGVEVNVRVPGEVPVLPPGTSPENLPPPEFVDYNNGSDLVTMVMTSTLVTQVFAAILAVAVVLLIFFTILQLIRNQWKEKDGGSPYVTVFRMFKGMVLFLFITAAVLVGIVVNGFVFNALNQATRLGREGVSMSGMVFQAAATPGSRLLSQPNGFEHFNNRIVRQIQALDDERSVWVVELPDEGIEIDAELMMEGIYFEIAGEANYNLHAFVVTQTERLFNPRGSFQAVITGVELDWDALMEDNASLFGVAAVNNTTARIVQEIQEMERARREREVGELVTDISAEDRVAEIRQTAEFVNSEQFNSDVAARAPENFYLRRASSALWQFGEVPVMFDPSIYIFDDPDDADTALAQAIGTISHNMLATPGFHTSVSGYETGDPGGRLHLAIGHTVRQINNNNDRHEESDPFFREGNEMRVVDIGQEAVDFTPPPIRRETIARPSINLASATDPLFETFVLTYIDKIEYVFTGGDPRWIITDRARTETIYIPLFNGNNALNQLRDNQFRDSAFLWVTINGENQNLLFAEALGLGQGDLPIFSSENAFRTPEDTQTVARWISHEMASTRPNYMLFYASNRFTPDSERFPSENIIGFLTYTDVNVVILLFHVSEMSWFFAWMGIIIIAGVLINFGFALIQRLVEMATLYMMSPLTLSFYPFDDGKAFQDAFVRPFYQKLILVYAPVLSLNLFFVIYPAIMGSFDITEDEPSGLTFFQGEWLMNLLARGFVMIALFSMIPAIRNVIQNAIGAQGGLEQKKFSEVYKSAWNNSFGQTGATSLVGRAAGLENPWKQNIGRAGAIGKFGIGSTEWQQRIAARKQLGQGFLERNTGALLGDGTKLGEWRMKHGIGGQQRDVLIAGQRQTIEAALNKRESVGVEKRAEATGAMIPLNRTRQLREEQIKLKEEKDKADADIKAAADAYKVAGDDTQRKAAKDKMHEAAMKQERIKNDLAQNEEELKGARKWAGQKFFGTDELSASQQKALQELEDADWETSDTAIAKKLGVPDLSTADPKAVKAAKAEARKGSEAVLARHDLRRIAYESDIKGKYQERQQGKIVEAGSYEIAKYMKNIVDSTKTSVTMNVHNSEGFMKIMQDNKMDFAKAIKELGKILKENNGDLSKSVYFQKDEGGLNDGDKLVAAFDKAQKDGKRDDYLKEVVTYTGKFNVLGDQYGNKRGDSEEAVNNAAARLFNMLYAEAEQQKLKTAREAAGNLEFQALQTMERKLADAAATVNADSNVKAIFEAAMKKKIIDENGKERMAFDPSLMKDGKLDAEAMFGKRFDDQMFQGVIADLKTMVESGKDVNGNALSGEYVQTLNSYIKSLGEYKGTVHSAEKHGDEQDRLMRWMQMFNKEFGNASSIIGTARDVGGK